MQSKTLTNTTQLIDKQRGFTQLASQVAPTYTASPSRARPPGARRVVGAAMPRCTARRAALPP